MVVDAGDPNHNNKHKKTLVPQARLLLFQLGTRRGFVLRTWPRLGLVDHVTVTARQDGSFILLTSDKKAVHAFRFVADADGSVDWTGHAELDGELLDEPYLSSVGVVVFLGKRKSPAQAETQAVTVLTDASFHKGFGCPDAF